MSMDNRNRYINVALLLGSIASCVYLLMLGWFNHLQLDDYGFVVDAENLGIFGFAKHMYMTWECRFSAFVVQNILNITIGRMSNLILLTIIQLIFAYSSIYLLYKYIFQIKCNFVVWNLAIITANIAIMSYFELSTFYWLSAAWYNLPIFTTIYLIVFLFYSKARIGWRWVGVILCVLYLSGCPENYLPIVIVSLTSYFVYLLWQRKTISFWKDERLLMTFVTLVLLSVGMLSMLLGPGNKVRMQASGMTDTNMFSHLFIPAYFLKSIKAFAIVSIRLLSRCLYFLLLVPIFMYVGYCVKQNRTNLQWFNWANLGYVTIIMLCLLILTVSVSVYGLGWYPPLRSYCFVSFIMAFYFAALGVCLGGLIQWKKFTLYGFVIADLVITIMSIRFFVQDYPIVKEYHKNITMLQQEIRYSVEHKRTVPLYVSKIDLPTRPNTYARLRLFINAHIFNTDSIIPEPNTYAPYMAIKLSTNPTYFVNKGIQNYYGANFDIIGWEE